jgi:uncharacterized protein
MDTIQKIYAEVPDARCKGLCHQACGPIAMSPAEQCAIAAKHGTAPEAVVGTLTCTKLSGTRCSIYADRPLICRLYGTTRQLRCQHGCGPAGGFMPERDAKKLLHRAQRLR